MRRNRRRESERGKGKRISQNEEATFLISLLHVVLHTSCSSTRRKRRKMKKRYSRRIKDYRQNVEATFLISLLHVVLHTSCTSTRLEAR